MEGYFDSAGSPKVKLEIKGTSGQTKTIEALLDTGHSGGLSLSVLQLIEMGAVLKTMGPIRFGNGQEQMCPYFSVMIKVQGEWKEVHASMLGGGEAIAGLELFLPYIATIDFKKRTIEFKDSTSSTEEEN